MRYGLLALLLGLAARADGLVRMCQSDDQIGPGSFSAEIQGGGTIRFQCGTAPATIRITHTHEIDASTTIEGDNRITLDAGGRSLRMFSVVRGGGLELSHITLKGGGPPPVSPIGNCPAGSIVNVMASGAEVRMTNVTVAASVDAIQLCRDTRFEITASGFFDNRGTALVLSEQASGRIDETSFIGNERAISAGSAPLRLYKTLFQGNTRCGLDVHLPADIEIHHGQFLKNGGPSGAAIRLSGRAGSVVVRSTSFADNHADAGGAIAIEPFRSLTPLGSRIASGLAPTRLRLVDATFSGNQAQTGGALSADMGDGGTVEIVRGLFTGNVAQDKGGAISVSYGGLSLAGSILARNRSGDGAAIFVQWPRQRSVTLANTLIAGNEAQAGGGALSGATFVLLHSTVARNAAVGVLGVPSGGASAARLWNSIVAENQPANCAGALAQFSVKGASLQFPARSGCPGTIEADPLLDEMFAPMPGSPAIAASGDKACFAPPIDGRDLYFQARPNAGKCSLGAVEYFPERVVARLLRERPRDEGERTPTGPRSPRSQTPAGGRVRGSAEAKQAVLDALAAGERAGPRRLHIELESNGRGFEQTLEIVPPDRAHVVMRTNGDTEEAYSIGDSLYTQVKGAWHAAPKASIPFDGLAYTAKFFGDTLTAVRSPVAAMRGGRAVQVYGADMRWTLHGKAASGIGEIVIDRDARRPLGLTFEGTCAGAACKFTETFEYDAAIAIRAPM